MSLSVLEIVKDGGRDEGGMEEGRGVGGGECRREESGGRRGRMQPDLT